MTLTTIIDGHLLDLAYDDDHQVVCLLADIARNRLGPLVGEDDALAWLLEVANRLARGETVPRPARPRPMGHMVYERWVMAQRVGDVMREDGLTEDAALAMVARAANKPGARGMIYDALKRYQAGDIPPDLYPIPSDAARRLTTFEKRLAAARSARHSSP